MTIQVATRLDKTIKEKAERVVATQGLNLSDCLRIFITKIANEQRIPIRIDNRVVSLDGDSFGSDQEYFAQIPGFFEMLDKVDNEPIGCGISVDNLDWGK
jgi:antitoxin component of RelBE/YafQ-DinJ toxin-antitoxin module